MFPSTQETTDIAEQLRKRQLLQDMAAQKQQPQSTPVPDTMQPQRGYDPTQAIESTAQQMGQFKPPDMTDYNKAAREYAAPIQAPRAGAIDPSTGKSQFPRNKLLTALVAPLMFKQILRNPKAGLEGLNVLTRKGYGAAEEKYAQDTEQLERNFKVQSSVLNENNKAFLDKLAGAKDSIEANKFLAEYKQKMKEWPLDLQLKAQDLADKQQAAKRADMPLVQNETFHVHTKGGDVTAQMRHNKDGTFDFIRPGEKDPVEGVLGYDKATEPRQLTNDEQVFKALSESWFEANPQWVKDHGKNLPGNVATSINSKVAESRQEYAAQQRMALLAERESKHRLDMEKALQGREFLQSRGKDLAQMDADRKPLITQLEALRASAEALKIGNTNGVAANMALIDQVMSGASKMSSRYNSKEIDRILGGAGKWNEFKAKFQQYAMGKSGVPKEVLDQMKELMEVTQNEIKRQIQINTKYRRQAEGVTDPTKFIETMGKYDRELNDYDEWNKAAQSPEDRLKALEAEQARRKK